jgi:6-phosphogluconolactonase
VDGARDGAAGADLAPLPAGTPIVYVGGVDIRIFGLDLATGMLTPRATVMAGGGYMAWDPGKKHMYSTATGITAFSIDQRTGGLSRLNSVMVTKDGTTPTGLAHLSVHPTGKWVFAAYFSSGHVASVAAGADGSLGAVVDIEAPGREAHSAWSDAAGKYLFVPCRVANLVGQYVVGADGALTPNMPANVQAQAAGAGPRHMAFHPTQPWAYVLNELGGTTTQYRFDAATGRLTDPATVSNVPMGMTEGSSAHIVVHPNGKFVYASNRMNNNLVVFAIDQTTGRLTPMQHEGGDGMIRTPRNFTLDPTGRYAIVASQNGGTVLVFRIDQNDGKLTRVGGAIPGPSGAQFVGVITLP